jgi:hypothetical protein
MTLLKRSFTSSAMGFTAGFLTSVNIALGSAIETMTPPSRWYVYQLEQLRLAGDAERGLEGDKLVNDRVAGRGGLHLDVKPAEVRLPAGPQVLCPK